MQHLNELQSASRKNHHILIVGAGISGATIAERYASQLHKNVLVVEKRDHIGGNCFDYYDEAGVLISKYGAHIFHTSFEDVWKYVNTFSEWIPYVHRVLSSVDGTLVPVPVNITTVNTLFDLHIQTEDEMKHWLSQQIVSIEHPQNSEESALARVGPVLYEKLFKHYTMKQWDTHPKDLDATVLNRIPVRTNFDDRYFTDPHQGMPKKGYTPLFQNMLSHSNIEVLLNTDYFELRPEMRNAEATFFTGPIDRFFEYNVGEKLQYRSLKFEYETFYDQEFYQQNSVINYPNEYDYTRIVEYKHMTMQKSPHTTISKEYPSWQGEPYYPVPSPRNQTLYDQYQQEAHKLEEKRIYFVGRLANYKYFNMDQAFKNALDLYARLNQ